MASILASFIKLLNETNGYRLDLSKSGFDSRLRLQKYVFLAETLGINIGYKFNLYLYGPYSIGLAKAYYNITKDEIDASSNLHDTFDTDTFLSLIADKDSMWLEAAATLKSIYEFNSGITEENLIDHVNSIKPKFKKEYLIQVLTEVRSTLSILY